VNDTPGEARATPGDILDAVQAFRTGEIGLSEFLNTTMDRIRGLEALPGLDVTALEDFWMDAEVVYALAAEARQDTLDVEQATAVEEAIDGMVRVLTPAL
jgi:hypothetical protein